MAAGWSERLLISRPVTCSLTTVADRVWRRVQEIKSTDKDESQFSWPKITVAVTYILATSSLLGKIVLPSCTLPERFSVGLSSSTPLWPSEMALTPLLGQKREEEGGVFPSKTWCFGHRRRFCKETRDRSRSDWPREDKLFFLDSAVADSITFSRYSVQDGNSVQFNQEFVLLADWPWTCRRVPLS